MTFRKKTLLLVILIATLGVQAQTVMEMHMFNRYQNLGTARSAGAGGAFSALGNDFSALTINPAGAGVFRREKTDVHLGIFGNSASTQFPGEEQFDKQIKSGFTFTNIGKLWMMNEERNRSSAFALTLNQNMSFREEYSGFGFAENPEGDLFEPDDYYDEINQRSIRGSQYDLGLTFGFNEGYKWYYGFGVGIPFSSFQQNYINDQHVEDVNEDIVGTSIYNEFIDVTGVGINARVGVIYRPIPALRIGVSAQTPTAHAFNGEFDFQIEDDGILETDGSRNFFNPNYRYTMYTAGRLNAGVAYVFGKFGLLSLDYDYINPQRSTYGGRDFGEEKHDINEGISNDLAPMHFLRAGTELRLDNFFIRGGYSFTTSGFVDNYQATPTTGIHAGLGYQGERIGINLSLVNFQNTTGEFLFDTQAITSPYLVDRSRTMFTIGLTILQ